MNTRTKLMLLCLFANTITAEADAPARDYKTVNFDNGITSRILEIGTTSVTFSVECASGITLPHKLMLIGKLNMDWDAWNFWGEMDVVQTQGMAIVEYPYEWALPLEPNITMFAQKAFFSLQILVSDEEWKRTWEADGYGKNGTIEPPLNAPPVVITETADQEQNSTVKGESPRSADIKSEQGKISEDETNISSPNYWWLCLGIVLLLIAVFYVVRRKTGN